MIVCLMALMIFAAAPVMACGSSCGGDKDKDETGFTAEYQTLCGGNKGDKPAPDPDPDPACSGGKDKKDKDDQAFTPDFQTLCGGDKGDKPAPDPDPACGGGDKKDKDEIKT